MATAHKLTPLQVKNLKEAGLYGDGGGLSLKVTPQGGKSWIFRYMVAGKATWMGLGAYPDVTLAEAREHAARNREKIRAGINPLEDKRAKKAALKAVSNQDVMTFDMCAETYIATFEHTWKSPKHRDQWRSTLKTYASSTIGAMDVAKITTDNVLEVLEPIWKRVPETAGRLRGRLETILDWATAMKYRAGDNPARLKGNLEFLLPVGSRTARIEHQPALPFKQMPEFMKALHAIDGISARACEFAILTAARSGEVRLAAWSEIDEEAGLWIVPGARMKVGKEHRVPLSNEAKAIITEMRKIASDENLIFPGAKKTGDGKAKPMSDMSLTAVFRRMHDARAKENLPGWVDPSSGRTITVHGTARSTFRDWIAEETEYPGEMAEIALSHTVSNRVEAAYRRGTMIEKRRAMMQDWANYCFSLIDGNAER